MIEEEIFYPAFRGKIESDMLDEAYVEHDGVKVLINDIESASPSADFYDAKATELSEIKHYVDELEIPSEGMFAQSRRADVDLVTLRNRTLAGNEELLTEAENGGLPLAKSSALKLLSP